MIGADVSHPALPSEPGPTISEAIVRLHSTVAADDCGVRLRFSVLPIIAKKLFPSDFLFSHSTAFEAVVRDLYAAVGVLGSFDR